MARVLLTPEEKDERRKLREIKKQRNLREQIFAAYGKQCVCCGEATIEFLCLDHIAGGGGQERKRYGNGRNLWLELRRKGFPNDGRYRTLCANCHQAKNGGKMCPHEIQKANCPATQDRPSVG